LSFSAPGIGIADLREIASMIKEDKMKIRILSVIVSLSICILAAAPVKAEFNAGLKAYTRGDFKTALTEFRADKSAQAKYYLSMMYDRGDGVAQDHGKSLEWLRRAAEQGLDVAQANLGLMYYEGYTVKKDTSEGLRWLRLAAAQGLEEAQSVIMSASSDYR
jgi:TPR repeat protein